jgi:mannose-6-phosphate isomerase-like protein (cupin superfamily)
MLMVGSQDVKQIFPHPNIVLKDWGYERWIENNDKYCMKLLHCEDGKWSSKGKFHYHEIKDETFFIVSGELKLEVEVDDNIRTFVLTQGDSFRVKPGTRHRFMCIGDDCDFIEASTTHSDEDSYRCYWDFEQETWINE